MSEESGEPKPSKLKLSSSINQPDKQQSAPPASAPAPSAPASLPPKVETPQPEAPKAASKQATTPPPLAKKPATRTSNVAPRKVDRPAKPTPSTPEKNNPLGSILIVIAILFILASAAGGIWFLLGSDQPATTEGAETPALEASPSNPVERAKATIATVPDRNLNKVLDPESTPAPESKSTTEAKEPLPLKEAVSQYLQNIHIDGVRTGQRARIMVNGENYNINDTVDTATGLIFIGTRDQKLRFKDSNGTIYVKSF